MLWQWYFVVNSSVQYWQIAVNYTNAGTQEIRNVYSLKPYPIDYNNYWFGKFQHSFGIYKNIKLY